MLSRTSVTRVRRLLTLPSAPFRSASSPPGSAPPTSSGWDTPWSPARPIISAAAADAGMGTGAGAEIGSGMGTSRPSTPYTVPGSAPHTSPIKDYTAVHKRMPGKGSGKAGKAKVAAETQQQSKPTSSPKTAEVCVLKSPYSGEVVSEDPMLTPNEVSALVAKAASAQEEWSRVSLLDRTFAVRALIAELLASRDEIAAEISLHMGKPLWQAQNEIDGMASRGDAFIDIAASALAPRVVEDGLSGSGRLPKHGWSAGAGGSGKGVNGNGAAAAAAIGTSTDTEASSATSVEPAAPVDAAQPYPYARAAAGTDAAVFERVLLREPVGVVAVVSPWNYPLMTSANAVIPSLLAGNALVLKPSPRTPGAARWWARAAAATGLFPDGLVAGGLFSHDTFASSILGNRKVGHVTLTGSVGAGKAVLAAAAAASATDAAPRFLSTALELGGKDGLYVAEDADVAAAAAAAAEGVCYNAGQSCCAVERVYVHKSVYKQFLEAVKSEMSKYKLGDPLKAETTMGPLALPDAPSRLRQHADSAISAGARSLLGYGCSDGRAGNATFPAQGSFFPPTLLADCSAASLATEEENFGPLLTVASVASDTEGVAKLNGSKFGLTASIWTSSPERAQTLARSVKAGTVFANRCDFVDPYLVWTGSGLSGLGAGVGEEGFRAVTRPKGMHFKFLKSEDGKGATETAAAEVVGK